jgi:plastocyanin
MASGGHWRRRVGLAFVTAIAVLSFVGLRAAAGQSATSATGSIGRTVGMVDFTYDPAPLRVSPETRVTFSNRSGIGHTATENGGGFDTGRVKPGESATIAFTRPGTYGFHCSLHPSMRGRIVVR